MKSKLSKKVNMYLRGSTDEALEIQGYQIEEFCKENNLIINKVYIDKCSSNEKTSKRVLGKLLAEPSKYDIIAFNIEKISRDVKELIKINKICKAQKKEIYLFEHEAFLSETFEKVRNILKEFDEFKDKELDL